MALTKEPAYAECFEVEPVVMGAMSSDFYRNDPSRMAWYFSRYKFVSRMLSEFELVAEIGCGDALASPLVAEKVEQLDLYDFDPVWGVPGMSVCDIRRQALPKLYDGIYMLDVIEHIRPDDERTAMCNICSSLKPHSVFIAGAPSLESQIYASRISKAHHVNCRSGEQFRGDMKKYFNNVFLFSMNDEVVHTGFYPMAHYLIAVCCGPR